MAAKLKTLGEVNVAVAGTEVQLTASTISARGVTIKALAANTGIIYVGDSTVTSSNGYPLAAGESIDINPIDGQSGLDVFMLSDIYVDASGNNQKVRVAYITHRG